jgi:hypothetical protein
VLCLFGLLQSSEYLLLPKQLPSTLDYLQPSTFPTQTKASQMPITPADHPVAQNVRRGPIKYIHVPSTGVIHRTQTCIAANAKPYYYWYQTRLNLVLGDMSMFGLYVIMICTKLVQIYGWVLQIRSIHEESLSSGTTSVSYRGSR